MTPEETIEFISVIQCHWFGYVFNEKKVDEMTSEFREYPLETMLKVLRDLRRNPANTYPPSTPQIWGGLAKYDATLNRQNLPAYQLTERQEVRSHPDPAAEVESQREKINAICGRGYRDES